MVGGWKIGGIFMYLLVESGENDKWGLDDGGWGRESEGKREKILLELEKWKLGL